MENNTGRNFEDSNAIARRLLGSDDAEFFCDNYFHDFTIDSVRFSVFGNRLTLVLSDDAKSYEIVLSKIFAYMYNIDFLVGEKDYGILSWQNVFKPMKGKHLLEMSFAESTYSKIAETYIGRLAARMKIESDFGYNMSVDFLSIGITIEDIGSA